MKLSNKTKRVLAGVLGIAIILLLLLGMLVRSGDPVSRAWADFRAVQYAEKLYPGQKFYVSRSYDGQEFRYSAVVQSQQSTDTWFEVNTQWWFFTNDSTYRGPDHEYRVEQRYNTLKRLEEEAQTLADSVVKLEFPYFDIHCNVLLGYSCEEDGALEDCLDGYRRLLELDTPFSTELMSKLPSVVYVNVTWKAIPTERDIQDMLHSVKAAMEHSGLRFDYYSVNLYPDENVVGVNGKADSGFVSADTIPS